MQLLINHLMKELQLLECLRMQLIVKEIAIMMNHK